MIGLDSNLLVRLLTGDDAVQCERVVELLERSAATKDGCFVSNIALCELEWVLEDAYGASRQDVASALTALLARPLFVFEDRASVHDCLDTYLASKGDLSDYLLGAVGRGRGASTTFTFDRALRDAVDFTLL